MDTAFPPPPAAAPLPLPTPAPLTPGLLVLHGNRLELLADAVLDFLRRHPLGPLEEEVVLVPSIGMAEWLKMTLAQGLGICAATRVELPARFLWRAYRAVLGRGAVPPAAPLDKAALTWRLMSLLPALVRQEPEAAPVAAFLGESGGSAERQLQLATRLADLFDQYQVYRADWLADWAAGQARLRGPGDRGAPAVPVPAGQRWQPLLWRTLLAGLSPAEREGHRAALHQRFLRALAEAPPGAARPWPGLPRRLVLFGTTHIPHQTLEALAALAPHVQVLMAVPNPCRFHWADLIDGREWLAHPRRRHAWRGGVDTAALPPEQLHAHGHPLLAAWGRQARDFVRQLDAFDDAVAAQARFEVPRVDLFDETPASTQLGQVQAAIRELQPLAEQRPPGSPPLPLAADDRSIVFHVAHGPLREVEVLHDALLDLLAAPPGGRPLAPRDIVVMVPDIERFAPAIRAVFGQHGRGDPRHIPWGIADLRERGGSALMRAVEWLLRAPGQRFGATELRALLELPAVAQRLQLGETGRATLLGWIEGAGIRWGLHAAHREALGLGAAGETGTWRHGLQRMLLGYATGSLPAAAAGTAGPADGVDGSDRTAGPPDLDPFDEVAGLEARHAGALALLLELLEAWWQDARRPMRPAAWAARLRALLEALFEAPDDATRAQLAALDEGLAQWLAACETAGFDDPVDLAIAREAWLAAVDEPGGGQRFKAGGVTFCTLLPLRAVPFEVVCLLGMNDGDYPRRAARSDFDLMALPGLARPGDRSRRDDDRQLMLDALLSARRVLHLSWSGRSPRDQGEQPPSVLVAQLRDHLAALWGPEALAARTTQHPLQPFSRRYFEPGSGLATHAHEWRSAHEAAASGPVPPSEPRPPRAAEAPPVFTLEGLQQLLNRPTRTWFRHRLQVAFDELDPALSDDEVFAADGLAQWAWREALLQAALGAAPDAAPAALRAEAARLRRTGQLPLGAPGRHVEQALWRTVEPMLAQRARVRARHPEAAPRVALRFPALPDAETTAGATLVDWLDGLLEGPPGEAPLQLQLTASRIATPSGAASAGLRPDKGLPVWLTLLAGAACGHPVRVMLIGADACCECPPLAPEEAGPALRALLDAAGEALAAEAPWPVTLKTSLLELAGKPEAAATAFQGTDRQPGEGAEPCVARVFADHGALAAHPLYRAAAERLHGAYAAWLRGVATEPLPDAAPTEDDADD